jgi:hypothetical protein
MKRIIGIPLTKSQKDAKHTKPPSPTLSTVISKACTTNYNKTDEHFYNSVIRRM